MTISLLKKSAFTAALFISSLVSFSQSIGSWNNSDMTPRKMEAALPTAGTLSTDVNLFNGELQATEVLGTVSAPAGLSFTLTMSYHNDILLGSTPSVADGIPYGKGWSLNIPTLSISMADYQTASSWNTLCEAEIGDCPQTDEIINPREEGKLAWHNLNVNIPGVASGKAVFKNRPPGIDASARNGACFVLEGFDTYLEIWRVGSNFIAVSQDGIYYNFDVAVRSYRNPVSARYEEYDYLNNMYMGLFIDSSNTYIPFEQDKIVNKNIHAPKEEYLTFYVSYIYNSNTMEGITFEYESFGGQDYFPEYNQTVASNDFRAFLNFTVNPGLNGFGPFEAYSDILLKSIYSGTPLNLIDELELVYATQNVGSPDMLNHRDAGVGRLDSLYNFKTVYSTVSSGCSDWKRFYHRKVPIPGMGQGNIGDLNPYVDTYGNMNMGQVSGSPSYITFDHAYLESPRIGINDKNLRIPGDMYRLKSKLIDSDEDEGANIDFNIVTGFNYTGEPTESGTLEKNQSFDNPRSETIFSTFGRSIKWNTTGDGSDSTTTSSLFQMPYIPENYDGYYIQIGPANSDNKYSLGQAGNEDLQENSYYSYFHDIHNRPGVVNDMYCPDYGSGPNVTALYAHDRIPANFGIGLPWSGVLDAYQHIFNLDDRSSGPTCCAYANSAGFQRWWNTTDINGSVINYANPYPNNPTYCDNTVAVGKIELVRYSKNPYMLSQVNLYKYSGNTQVYDSIGSEARKLISQKLLRYNVNLQPMYRIDAFSGRHGAKYLKDSSNNWIDDYDGDSISDRLQGLDQYGVPAGLQDYNFNGEEDWDEDIDNNSIPDGYQHGRPRIIPAWQLAADSLLRKTLLVYGTIGTADVRYFPRFDSLEYAVIKFSSMGLETMDNLNKTEFLLNRIVDVPVAEKEEQPLEYDWNDLKNYPHVTLTYSDLVLQEDYEGMEFYSLSHPFGFTPNFTVLPKLKVLTGIVDKLGGKKVIAYYAFNRPQTMMFYRYQGFSCPGGAPPFAPLVNLSTYRPLLQVNVAVKGVSSIDQNNEPITRDYEYDLLSFIDKSQYPWNILDSIGSNGIGGYWKNRLPPIYERGFGKTTEYFPHFGDTTQRSKSIHYFHSTPVWASDTIDVINHNGASVTIDTQIVPVRYNYDSLTWRKNYYLFGRLRKTENYNYLGQKVTETENEYEVQVAYKNGMRRPNIYGNNYMDYLYNEPEVVTTTTAQIDDLKNDLSFSSAFKDIQFGETGSNLKSYFLKKTKDISREFDANGICQNTGQTATNIEGVGIYHYDDEEIIETDKVFNVKSGTAHTNAATLTTTQRDNLLYHIYKEGATVSNMLSEFAPFTAVTDTVLYALAHFEGESVFEVIKNYGPYSNHILTAIAVSNNLTDAEKQQLVSTQQPLQNSFLTAKIQSVINGGSAQEEEALKVLSLGTPLGRATMNELAANADSLPPDFLLKISLQQPWLNEDYIITILNNRKDFPSGHLTELLSHHRILTDNVYEAIFNMDSLPDENTLLQLATEVAYPSDSVLYYIISENTAFSTDFMLSLLNLSPYQLEEATVNKVVSNFNIPISLVTWNFEGKQPLIACYPQQTCILVLEQITEYDYYDADHRGRSYSPGYNSFKEPHVYQGNYTLLDHEPSWMLHRSKSYSPQQPDTYSEQRYYYFWDRHDGSFDQSDVYERMNIMGWRSLAYQTMERTKAVGLPEKEKSTFYLYDRRWNLPPLPTFDIEYFVGEGECPQEPDDSHPDPRPNDWEEFESSIGIDEAEERQMYIGDRLRKRVMLREINVQVAEPILDSLDPGGYMQTEDEGNWLLPSLPEAEVRLVSGELEYDTIYALPRMRYVYPCPVVRTAHILERNLYHQPNLVEDEKGLRYRYFFQTPYRRHYQDTLNTCHSYVVSMYNFPAMPMAITIGSGLADSLYTTYEYDENTLLLTGETDPNGMETTYEYDKWRRPKNAFINGAKIGSNSYHYWNQDTYNESMSFADRAEGNWMEAVVYNSTSTSDPVEQTRSYADPLGRAFHTWSRTVTPANLTAPASSLLHSGQQVYDSWGRVIKAYKPFVKTGTNLPLEPLSNTTAASTFDDSWSTATFENDPRSRLHFSSKPAATGTETHQVALEYKLMTGSVLACELDLSLSNANEMMAQSFNDYVFRRTKTTDEDGKTVWEYSYPNGQKVAERRRINNYHYAITLFFYDSQGNLRKTVNPEKQQSIYKYNLAGGMYEKKTPDDGTVRYMYNRSGQVVLEQDATMRKGIPLNNYDWDDDKDHLPDLFPYYRQYCYDIYGRMVLQQKLMIQPDHRPLEEEVPMLELVMHTWPLNALAYEDTEPTNSTLGTTEITDSYGYHFLDRSTLSWLAKAVYDRTTWYVAPEAVTYFAQTGLEDYYIYEGFTNDPPLISHATVIPEKKWIYGYNFTPVPYTETYLLYNGTVSRARGRLSYTEAYKDMEDRFPLIVHQQPSLTPAVEMVWLGYNNKGQLNREYHRMNNNGITYDYDGYEYAIEYPAYDLRGNVLQQVVDIWGDNKADMRYTYTYDARGRLKDVYMALGTGTNDKNKIASYTYDDARGTVSELRHNVRCGSADENLNVIDYDYDHRDRLTKISSKWYRENIYYDAQQSLQGINISQNYNGNINAIQHIFLNGANSGNTFNLAAISDFSGANKHTLYGYTYDGLNRLTRADAKVAQRAQSYGDTEYSFDKIGNIKRHRRGWSYGPSQNQPEIWDYKYVQGKNHLQKALALNSYTATRNYTYDRNGNMATDPHSDVIGVRYDRANLPTRINRDYHDNVNRYTYNAADQRIAKLSGSLAAAEVEGYELYLRDAAGRELATIDIKVGTMEWYGYGTERIARFRPQSDQRSMPAASNFASTTSGMLLNEHGSLVNYPIDIVYGKVGDVPYVYRKDYLERLDTVPEIPDTLGRSFVAQYETTINTHAKLLLEIASARVTEQTSLRIIEQGGVGPLSILIPWNPEGPVRPIGPPPPPPPPPPPVYPLVCHCPDAIHLRDNAGAVVTTFNSFSNKAMENITFYLYDHLGNTRVTYYLRNCTSTVVVENILDYDPYGKVLRSFSNDPYDKEKYVTTQHERDKETGYDYRGARFYDSDIARFLSVDPLSSKFFAWSSYNYVVGNPIYFIDPKGSAATPPSTHVDQLGNIIAKYDDGDNGVYMHSNWTTEEQISQQRTDNKNTGGNGSLIGEIGGTIDANTIYKNTLSRHIIVADKIWWPGTFIDLVKSFGDWDLKNNQNTIYGRGNDGKTQFSFEGKLMESQDIGNHHFGAVSLSYGLFPSEKFILQQAGDYQIKSGTSKPEWQPTRTRIQTNEFGQSRTITERLPPYGDDPRDQEWIKSGFQYYKNNK